MIVVCVSARAFSVASECAVAAGLAVIYPSLDEALRYLRQRYDDLLITEARCVGMVALLSGSPLD